MVAGAKRRWGVMAVEDDEAIRTDFESGVRAHSQLSWLGGAGSLRAALQLFDRCDSPPDVMLVDLGLPDGSGLDVVRSARQRAGGPPVIVVTGFASSQSRREALEAGASAYLAKPFSVLALSSLIQGALAPPPV